MDKFFEKLKDRISGFDYLRLNSAQLFLKKNTLELIFIYPHSKENELNEGKARICDAIRDVLRCSYTLDIKFRRSHFDDRFFRAAFFKFLQDYPALLSGIKDENIFIETQDDIKITVRVEKSLSEYVLQSGIEAAIGEFIASNYCEKIDFSFDVFSLSQAEYDELLRSSADILPSQAEEFRQIVPTNVEAVIGDEIKGGAFYIGDVSAPRENVVLCGVLTECDERISKPKEDGTQKTFLTFRLEDFSGAIRGVYFPNKRTVDKISNIKQGAQIIARGKCEFDNYRKDGSLNFIANQISLCALPKDAAINRQARAVPKDYAVVFPTKYTHSIQRTLLELGAGECTRSLAGKTFCVFDVETTGINPVNDSLIEIGAVKIENGVITQAFETLIDPKIPIPYKITQLTGITDADVAGKPQAAAALLDFYKFCDGCVFVGHNISFDIAFIKDKGKALGIYFDNDKQDTYLMSRRYCSDLKRYTLTDLCSYFKVTNARPHRALFDAIASAEVFIKMCEKVDKLSDSAAG